MPTKPAVLHYNSSSEASFARCGIYTLSSGNMTTDPDETTCERCLASIRAEATLVANMTLHRRKRDAAERVNGFLNEWESNSQKTGTILTLGFMRDGEAVELALTTDDLRVLAYVN